MRESKPGNGNYNKVSKTHKYGKKPREVQKESQRERHEEKPRGAETEEGRSGHTEVLRETAKERRPEMCMHAPPPTNTNTSAVLASLPRTPTQQIPSFLL